VLRGFSRLVAYGEDLLPLGGLVESIRAAATEWHEMTDRFAMTESDDSSKFSILDRSLRLDSTSDAQRSIVDRKVRMDSAPSVPRESAPPPPAPDRVERPATGAK
jgi:hypothetical protein